MAAETENDKIFGTMTVRRKIQAANLGFLTAARTKKLLGYGDNDWQPEMIIWPPKPEIHTSVSSMSDSIENPTADLWLLKF